MKLISIQRNRTFLFLALVLTTAFLCATFFAAGFLVTADLLVALDLVDLFLAVAIRSSLINRV